MKARLERQELGIEEQEGAEELPQAEVLNTPKRVEEVRGVLRASE